MARTRLERILDAAFDAAADWIIGKIDETKERGLELDKSPKAGEPAIIDADFEDLPAKALPEARKGPRTRSRPRKPTS